MKNLKSLLPYLKKYKFRLYLGFLFVTISNISSTYMPRIVGETVDIFSIGQFDKDYIYMQIIYILLLTLSSGLFMFLTRQTIIYASRLIEYDLRYDFMKVILNSPLEFFKKNSVGSLMAYANNDIPAAREFIGPAIMYGANTVTTFAFAFFFMFSISIEMTIAAILPLPIIAISTYYLGKKVHIASKKVQDQYAKLTGQAQETISGVRIVRAYNRHQDECNIFSEMSEDYLNKNLKLARLQALFMPSMMIMVGISFIIVLGYGGFRVINGFSTIGDLTQFFIYLTILIWPVAAIGYITNIIQQASAAAVRLTELYKSVEANSIEHENGIAKLSGNNIIFNNVSITYEDSKRESLKNISIDIPSGSSLGITGPVGSGKTTFAGSLLLLNNISKGNIIIGNNDLSEYDLKKLRESISYVPQDTFLFSMSIADNIRFANSNASQEEVENAAIIAELHNEILSFEHGYDTILGERGITLSGGQKQRTSIARALLRKPEILILDDALSAVDASTEEKILNNLRNIIKLQTTIIISHRVSSIKHTDKIISIVNGEIAEIGNHDELLLSDGYYASIYHKQQLEQEISGL